MASIRRTSSPSRSNNHQRLRQIPSSSLFFFLLHNRKPHPHHHLYWDWGWDWSWSWSWSWRRSYLRWPLFSFIVGLLLGLFFFSHLHEAHDLQPHHFFFDSLSNPNPTHHTHSSNPGLIRSPPPPPTTPTTTHHDPVPGPDRPKLLIIVTPTYNRALQAYYLTRLGHTLRLVPSPLVWIVVEMNSASMETADLLRRSGVMYRHLVSDKTSITNVKDRGVHQRNTALDYIQRHRLDGIVYFADDDNIYSLHLFHHLRNIRRFGTWPVAMLAQSKNKATLEGPVCNGSQVIGWHTNEKSRRLRRFHVDMSGFAFNSTILWYPQRWHRPTSDAIRQLDTVKEGFQETTFIEQVVADESQMEGVPNDCSTIMNWHLHLGARHFVYPKGWQVSRNLDAVTSQRHDLPLEQHPAR